MRNVIFKLYNSELKQWEEVKGRWHQWGLEAMEDNQHGNINWSIGICEDEQGQVHSVSIDKIRFIA